MFYTILLEKLIFCSSIPSNESEGQTKSLKTIAPHYSYLETIVAKFMWKNSHKYYK